MAELSPLVGLATSMHAQPGVYALLLGSGVSTGAGIPTGWGVVRELVERVAAASGRDGEGDSRAARDDPEGWWAAYGEGELGYSTLLEQLATTPAVRQGLLAGFFEPDDDEREEGLKQPGTAHKGHRGAGQARFRSGHPDDEFRPSHGAGARGGRSLTTGHRAPGSHQRDGATGPLAGDSDQAPRRL